VPELEVEADVDGIGRRGQGRYEDDDGGMQIALLFASRPWPARPLPLRKKTSAFARETPRIERGVCPGT
jgi:hypothetical protein